MHNVFIDKVKGTIYGQAIGDALGLGTEFLSKSEVGQYYPAGLHDYEQIVRDLHRKRWERGDWTDDTEQMLCILDSLLSCREVDLLDIARRFYQWATQNGKGIGYTVHSVVFAPDFLRNPREVAKTVWQNTGKKRAANGGIMRTAILGIWQYQDSDKVIENAENVCQITHYDPRCIGSCIAVCLAISLLLQGEKDRDAILQKVREQTKDYHPEIEQYLSVVEQPLDALCLDEGMNRGEPNRIGYTLKAIAAAFWAFYNADSFEQGLLQIIHEGGDADSNASVSGALLGCRFGFSSIPERWIEGLCSGEKLSKKIEVLLRLLG